MYLALGFALNWLVVWVLSEVPRRISKGMYGFAQILETPPADGSPRRTTNVYDYRWFGVHEHQYGSHRRTLYNTWKPASGFWWSWAPIPATERQASVWFDRLHEEFDTPEQLFDPANAVYARMRYGWPALSAQAHGAYNDTTVLANGDFAQSTHGGFTSSVPSGFVSKIKVSSPLSKSVYLPYRPIWSGLMVNTIFWAMVVATVHSIKRAYRHARRMRKGRCPMCSYELGFTFKDGCPECGWRKGLAQ